MRKISSLIFFIFLCSIFSFALSDARLLRMPDINRNLVVFVYAGDIWSVSADGGEAKRLTSHEGMEIYPKISPDGKWIGFSAEYSGSRQIYVMPTKGGTPKQLTYYNEVGVMPPRGGWDNIVLDWTPDSKKILFRGNRTPYGRRVGKYFLIDIKGGFEKPLPIPDGGFGALSPDGSKFVYAPIGREFRTWKRTQGGRASDIWTYDLKKNIARQITKFKGTDQIPFWFKNKLYFASDRDLTLNIHSYDLKSQKINQITRHKEFDVMWPSHHNGLMVYENGGYIYKLDLKTQKTKKITVNLNFDNPNLLPYFKNVKSFIFNSGISPKGERVIFEARGDLFSVPAKKGITLNLTKTRTIREISPVWSPDGKWIAYISDKTGDYELYLMDPKGKKPGVQLTKNDKVWKFTPSWSPDGKLLIYNDADRKLNLLDIKTKKITTIAKGKTGNLNDYSWSADSEWIVYSKDDPNSLTSIWVYSLKQKKSLRITNSRYADYSPAFSINGKYIFFVSDRDFNMNFRTGFSSMEWDYVMNNTSRLYAVALTGEAKNLFKEKNDLEEESKPETKPASKKDKKDKDKKDKDKKKKKEPLVIDFKNINSRISAFPISNGNFGFVVDIGEKVLYAKNRELRLFDLKTKKDNLVIAGIRGGILTADNKKLLYRAKGKWGIIDIKPKQKVGTGTLDLKDLVLKIDPVKEWRQIFKDGWRIFRDWFYVYNMHGVDWKKMYDKYAKLLPYVSHRADLDYIFGELVGELNVGHTYVNWGDIKRVPRVNSGLLGADITADLKAKRYRISKIYQGENWNERTRSPLTEQGVKVKQGDYIIRINGTEVITGTNFYKYLENTAGKKISLTVNAKPGAAGAKTYWIKPLASEIGLFYFDWVNTRRKMVDKLSGGKIAYIHVPDTAVSGNREFFKGMYAYSNKKAFIIDDRNNGGGWSPNQMINKLSQKLSGYWHRRGLELAQVPTFAFNGPMVMLINHYSSSGGDWFPYLFKYRKLGKLIGTRTWGGLVGYGRSPRLIDGPSFAVPSSGFVNADGQHAVEGVGVYPDKGFEVFDRPDLVAQGRDPSIEVAVKYLLEQLKKHTFKKAKDPKDPDRSKWYEKKIK